MFPTNSYNSPMGYQFGREAAEFTEENAINPELWDDALTEQAYEQTPETRYAAVRDDAEQAEALATASRVEAQSYAVSSERETSREQIVADARLLSRLGSGMRYMRDHKNDYALTA